MIRRRNYFIKKKFQLKFAYHFLVLIAVQLILVGLLFMYISKDTVTAGYWDYMLKVDGTPAFFFMPLLLIMIIVGIGIIISGMVIFVLFSHKIAGPLYRFEKDLQDVAAGDLTKRIRIRKADQLVEFKDSLNAMIGSLDRRMSIIKTRLSKLEKILQGNDSADGTAEIRNIVDVIKEDIKRFRVTSSMHEKE